MHLKLLKKAQIQIAPKLTEDNEQFFLPDHTLQTRKYFILCKKWKAMYHPDQGSLEAS